MRSTVHSFSKTHHKHAFTLFEVSLSLALVAFGVISVLMLFPAGLKAQQMSRFQLLAATKAEEMIEQFNGTQHSNPALDTEGLAMWDVPVAHKAQSWDIESRLSSHRFGIMPVPLDIARRLDSANDEIHNIISSGGYIYYSQPLASTGTQEQSASVAPPNEAQRLIIGIKGPAQQNALSSFPLKNWPYHTPFPSPPLQMHHMADKYLPARVNKTHSNYKTHYYQYYSWPWKDNEDQIFNGRENIRNHSETYCVPWETSPAVPGSPTTGPGFLNDPDIQKVYDWPEDSLTVMVRPNYPEKAEPVVQPLHVGYFPYACGRLWEAGGYNVPAWKAEDPISVPNNYKIGHLVSHGGSNYTCILNHTVIASGPGNTVPKAAGSLHWRKIQKEFPATHLEQITRSLSSVAYQGVDDKKNQVGDAVYGEYPSRLSVGRYVAATLWYAERKGIMYAGDLDTVKNPYADFRNSDESKRWQEVQAFRFLAHSTTCLTGWYSYDSTETDNLKNGVIIPEVSLATIKSPKDVKITHALIKYYHERSLYLINRFASSYPYDWAVPRPLNRVTMMDYPLLQFDLFTPPLPFGLPRNPLYNSTTEQAPQKGVRASLANEDYSHIFGRSETDLPQQWRVLSPEPIRNVGVSASYPTNVINATMKRGGHDPLSHFGNADHYNITATFDASERCRQMVFWAVDWQSYEDFETAPSAPVDCSKYPLAAPRGEWHESGHIIPTNRTRSYSARMSDLEFRDEQLWSFRNPEKTLLFFIGNDGVDPRTLPTGAPVEQYMILNTNKKIISPGNEKYPDQGNGKEQRETFNGLFGADRNFNKVLNRGPVPRSVRLQAIEVARFNFYDPRVMAILR